MAPRNVKQKPQHQKPVQIGTATGRPVMRGTYMHDGTTAIYLAGVDGDDTPLFAHVSINVGADLAPGEFVVNHDLMPRTVDQLLAAGLFRDTGRRVDYGYVVGRPIWKVAA